MLYVSVPDANEAKDYYRSHIITAKNAKMVWLSLGPQLTCVCLCVCVQKPRAQTTNFSCTFSQALTFPLNLLHMTVPKPSNWLFQGLRGDIPSSRVGGGWKYAACGGLRQQHKLFTGARLEWYIREISSEQVHFYAFYLHCCAKRKQLVSCKQTKINK